MVISGWAKTSRLLEHHLQHPVDFPLVCPTCDPQLSPSSLVSISSSRPPASSSALLPPLQHPPGRVPVHGLRHGQRPSSSAGHRGKGGDIVCVCVCVHHPGGEGGGGGGCRRGRRWVMDLLRRTAPTGPDPRTTRQPVVKWIRGT